MAPTPLIPNGVYKIRNGQFYNIVADLIGGNPRGRIVGAIDHPSNEHDQWQITNYGDGGNQVTIQNVSTGTFADAKQAQNSLVHGSYVHTRWTLVKVDGGRYVIQSPNANFIWELPRGYPHVNIELVRHTGQDNAKWFFERLDD